WILKSSDKYHLFDDDEQKNWRWNSGPAHLTYNRVRGEVNDIRNKKNGAVKNEPRHKLLRCSGRFAEKLWKWWRKAVIKIPTGQADDEARRLVEELPAPPSRASG